MAHHRVSTLRRRSLTAVVLIVCLTAFVWLSLGWRQRGIVESIVKAGGSVSYEWESMREAPPPSNLMCTVFGVDFYANVYAVQFPRGTATDAILQRIGGLRHISLLAIGYSAITDAGLEQVASLRTLTVLSLAGTRVTDAGMKSLRALTNLEGLDLSETKVTDVGVGQLTGHSELERLNICKTGITEAGLERLRCLPKLHRLYVTAGRAGGLDGRKLKLALPNCEIYGVDESGDVKLLDKE